MALQVTHPSCRKYNMTHTDIAKKWNVRSVSDTILFTGDFSSGSSSFELSATGVYILREAYDLTNPSSDLLEYVIIEDCGLIDCLKKLILNLFCESDECGPCKDCGTQENGLRYELNKLIGGYSLIIMASMADKFEHWGIYSIDECRQQNLSELNSWITELEKIKNRCAEEDCSQTSTDTEECGSC